MSDVTVYARTQIIEVNEMGSTVAVVNAGPPGPSGPGGSLTAEQAVDAVAAALVPGTEIEITYDDPAGEITIAHKPDEVIHDWDVDGWTPFDTVLINDDTPTGTPGTQTLSVVSRRGRITNTGTQGSMRIVYPRDDTVWMDSEITTLCYGGNVFNNSGTNPALPQGGHFHRGYYDDDGFYRAIMVNNNIFLSDVNVINANVWNHDPVEAALNPADGLDLGPAGAQKNYNDDFLGRRVRITGANRFVFIGSVNEFQVTPGNHDLAVGSMVTVDPLLDSTFAQSTPAAVLGVSEGMVQMQDAEAGSAVTSKYENGWITPSSIHGQKYWPYWLKSRLIGSKLWVKAWRYNAREPDWADTRAVFTADFAAANNPAPDALYPDEAGHCGLIGAHIRNSRWFDYGMFQARKL